jgi:hypothetical protein
VADRGAREGRVGRLSIVTSARIPDDNPFISDRVERERV